MKMSKDALGSVLAWLGIVCVVLSVVVDLAAFIFSDEYWKVVWLSSPVLAVGVLCFALLGKLNKKDKTHKVSSSHR